MRFEAAGFYTQGVADVDPVAAPGTVADNHILNLARRQNDADVEGKRILLTLEAPAGETLTVELWALDEATFDSRIDSPDLATRRFYRFAAATLITAGIITEVTVACAPGGRVFARRTADALGAATTRRLLATCVP